jgi:ATP-dependent DNA ligase
VALPVTPPAAPTLARLAREIPVDRPYVYEPKWDGFRCLAVRCDVIAKDPTARLVFA